MLFDELLLDLQGKFDLISDPRRQYNHKYSLKNVLLSGVALFSLKDSSLLSFVEQYRTRKSNLKSVFGITQCPSDSGLRTILDRVEPKALQNILPNYVKLLAENGHLDAFSLDFSINSHTGSKKKS